VEDSNTFQSIAVAGGDRAGGGRGGGAGSGRVPAILYASPNVPSAEDIKQRIEAAIPGARAEVEDYTGGGDHFSATVTAAAFEGLTRIQQHRLVYEVFGAEVGGPIHALALKTLTPSPADAPARIQTP
jgi:stress-induced morphogen